VKQPFTTEPHDGVPVLQSDTLDNQHMKAYKFKVVLLRSDTFNGQHAKGSEFSRSIRKSVTN